MTAGPAAYPGGRDETAQRLHVLYERKRYQQMRAGNWAAFTATAPVREHLKVLREAGMTQGDISRQSGVSITAMGRAAKNPRMTIATANALLAVQPVTRDDGQQAAQALRSLVADGWTLQQLANTTGLTVRTIGRTVHGHTTPAAGSTTAIIDALDQLLFEDPGDSASSMRAPALVVSTRSTSEAVCPMTNGEWVKRCLTGPPLLVAREPRDAGSRSPTGSA